MPTRRSPAVGPSSGSTGAASEAGRGPALLGRREECAALDQVVASVRAGESRALVLRGEAGIGKSALLDHLEGRATGCRVVRASGVESEMELAFSGLHQLCAPMLDHLARLPGPQHDALAIAFGLSTGDAPDRFVVGLAVLSLLADAAEEVPLVCLVDDAQWLDQASAQTLAFVARRLLAESVALVFASLTGDGDQGLRELPELAVDGLQVADADALLGAALSAPLDAAVRDEIVAESRGNPLALLELPQGLTPTELAGGFGLPAVLPDRSRVEESFRRRVEALPVETQRLLLVAAVEPTGDSTLLWRAAHGLGIGFEAAVPATAAGLLDIGARARFRHPLVRSATVRAASSDDCRSAHLALAEATDPEVDPDRCAWHRAQATLGHDEEVAVELERSADRAQSRGGLAAAATFHERAAELTLDPRRRASRLLAAAEGRSRAGAPEAALSLLSAAAAGPLDDLQSALVDLLRGQIAFASSHGRDASPLLLAAASRLELLDPVLARDTYLDALSAALLVGRLSGEVGVSEVAGAARAARPWAEGPPDLLLDGLTLVITEGHAAGAPTLQRALTRFRAGDMVEAEAIRWLWLASHAAHDLWDDESWDVLCSRHVRLARKAGALAILPIALSARIGLHLYAGELVLASSLVDEIAVVTEATGSRLPPYGAVALAAWQGREAAASQLIRDCVEEVTARGEGMGLTLVENARAVLYNGLGRYEEALDAAQQAAEHPTELGFATLVLPELVEAAVRTGRSKLATDTLQRLATATRASGSRWALGVEARARALVSEDTDAERHYREAIDLLGGTRVRMELARAHLLFGEWLRRAGRRRRAREHLRLAHEMLSTMGAEAFAERARRELLATGETVRKRTDGTRLELTAQEAQVARLAGDGRTNLEIGAQMYISPRTVEWHMGKVLTKLGLSSRRQLRSAMLDGGRAIASV